MILLLISVGERDGETSKPMGMAGNLQWRSDVIGTYNPGWANRDFVYAGDYYFSQQDLIHSHFPMMQRLASKRLPQMSLVVYLHRHKTMEILEL